MIRPNSNVYFARCFTADGLDMNTVKIGLALDADFRLTALACRLPFECELICSVRGDMFIEAFLHMWLRKSCVGGEYFRRDDEVNRIIRAVELTGKLPMPIEMTGPEGVFIKKDCVSFMEERGITLKDISKHSGLVAKRYESLLRTKRYGNRRFLAALAVTAVRMGHSIKWPLDFNPSVAEQKAA